MRIRRKSRNCYEGVEIDADIFLNDIVSTAFEIFEKMSSFQAAIELPDESDRSWGTTCRIRNPAYRSEQKTDRIFQWFRKRTTDF